MCEHDPHCIGTHAAQEKILHDTEKGGWSVLAIADNPPFTYTVGLYKNHQQPELMLFGISPGIAGFTLNAIGSMMASGQALVPGQRYDQFIEHYDLIFIPVDLRYYSDYFGAGRWFYADNDFPVLQAVWPDPAGRFPWEDAFDAKYHRVQPLLGPAPQHFVSAPVSKANRA